LYHRCGGPWDEQTIHTTAKAQEASSAVLCSSPVYLTLHYGAPTRHHTRFSLNLHTHPLSCCHRPLPHILLPPPFHIPSSSRRQMGNSIHNPRHPTHIATKARIFTRGAPPLALFGSVFASESRSFRIRCLSLYTMNILRSFHECAFFFCSSSRFGIGPLPFFFTFSPWNNFLVLTFPTYMNTSFRVSAPFHFPPWQCINLTIPLPFYLVFPILKIATCVAVVGRLELGKG